jgi:uncharacterized membrane protein YoaK (UPF0700 family)
MTTSAPGPTRQEATTATGAPWYVWGLVGLATMAAGPVVGGGFDHPTLLVGGIVVFLVGAMTFAFLTRLTRVTVWFCLVLVVLACGVAVVDAAVTSTVLPTPIVSLVVTAVLALVAAILSIRRLGRA